MRYPNRLYAVEGGDLHYILSGPPDLYGPEDPDYLEYCAEADRREAELMAELKASRDRLRGAGP